MDKFTIGLVTIYILLFIIVIHLEDDFKKLKRRIEELEEKLNNDKDEGEE